MVRPKKKRQLMPGLPLTIVRPSGHSADATTVREVTHPELKASGPCRSTPPKQPPAEAAPVPLATRKFVEVYYRKHCKQGHQFTRTGRWLWGEENGLRCEGPVANVTLFEGGSFHVPEDRMNSYHVLHAADVANGDNVSLNERTTDTKEAALAFELDYRFASLDRVPEWETYFEAHVRSIVSTVRRYYVGTTSKDIRLMLFRCDPKPKKSEGTWKVAVGLHLIFNRKVTFEEGAQLSHSASCDLRAMNMALTDVVDNIYVGKSSYAKSASLRPPLSCKKVQCIFCNDHTKRKPADPTCLADVPLIRCAQCGSRGSLLDTNTYRLADVWDLQCRPDTEMLKRLQGDVAAMLAAASIWGMGSVRQPMHWPKGEPRYTVYEMNVDTQPPLSSLRPTDEQSRYNITQHHRQLGRSNDGGRINFSGDLVTFGLMNVKKKGEQGVVVPRNHAIRQQAKAILVQVSPFYDTCMITKLALFKKRHAMLISMSGRGSNHCMKRGNSHSSSGASVWLVDDRGDQRAYAGCYSKHCDSGFKPVTKFVNLTSVAQLFEMCRAKVPPRAER